MKLLRICTIFNNAEQRDTMRSSFESAGFSRSDVVFEGFDNTAGNTFEPYSTFNRVLETACEPYLIFCHQDIVLNRGDHFDTFKNRIEEMNRLHPDWAVLGNGGMTTNFQLVRCICDHWGESRDLPLPRRVVSLDENFLVVNRRAGVRFSNGLSGFHFYGIDLCLNSYRAGHACFVIDFQISHASKGNVHTADFRKIEKEFQDFWSQRFAFIYIASPCVTLFLSRYRWLA